jgi:hypothetical protein
LFEKEYTAYLEGQMKILLNLKLKIGYILSIVCFCIAIIFKDKNQFERTIRIVILCSIFYYLENKNYKSS